jgi:HlyD family secretion protein
LDELLAGARPQELEAARSDLAAAEAEAKRVAADLKRIQSLYDQKVVSAQMRDAAQAAHDVAESRLNVARERLALVKEGPRKESIERARAMLRQVQEQHALAVAGPRQETIEQARAHVKAAKEGLEAAKIQLNNATLVSPLTGMVLSNNVDDGEFVSPGMPVITVADLEHPWLRAYINETDLGKVNVGLKVEVTTDTFPDKTYAGAITFISPQAEFTPKSVQTEKERVKLVYRVKIEIANTNLEIKPGMPADGVILTAP